MTSVALEQAGRWGATQGYSVAAGNGEAGCRPARVKRPGNRGLAKLCHASKGGPELRDWGRIMLGVNARVSIININNGIKEQVQNIV